MSCSDVVKNEQVTQIEVSNILEGDHGHDDTDLCSPFCICQCCQNLLVSLHMMSYHIDNQGLFASIFTTNNGVKQEVSYAILHPPQI